MRITRRKGASTGLRLLIVLIVGFNLFLARPQPAWACICMPPASPRSALGQADAVFAGSVIAVLDPTGLPYYDRLVWRYVDFYPNTHYENFYSHLVIFKVENAWKGVADTFIIVRTGSVTSYCGYTFSPNHQYLVYSEDWQGDLWTGICTRTVELTEAGEDLGYLRGIPTLALAPPWLPLTGLSLALALIIGVIIGVLFWIIRRFRRMKAPLSTEAS